ncbi:hypothetical protein [Serratia phage X20]|uniref:Uncharacterized protein n=1 Tax=Serratia phage X20 TaxID=2006942 RepID=A0A1Z1LYZ8_9CAUD|nr:hypothetical protein KNT72_gp083 [Serratia phage X20]ARW58056.1 hypothetical protein [Serratia phage X20]
MNIEVKKIYAESGDCDLGCWNSADGYLVTIDGVEYDDLHPYASCCNSDSFNEGDLLNFIMSKVGRTDIHINFED